MVLLVDGNNLVNAAFYVAQAKADETNTEEVCEKTVNIFKSQIGKLENDFSPSKIYIAWDGRNGAKWRKEVLPEYKGGRSKEGKEKLFEALDICGEIDYSVYSELFDFSLLLIHKAYELGKKEYTK